ncbi:MAG: LysR family transcriptional regulator [Oscillospiraceae bacterium]|nr:LysR family transcriptional regulator [Oscillospiraceae bacterium]MBR0393394.1 LysR family transcriptional regulator [Oscillospiraceae bacterium]
MDSNLQKYLALLKTVECGSFTKAAEALGYTQYSVSKMIADLEQEWHVSLLERNRGGVLLTAEGTALLPYAQSLVNDYRILQERIAELNGLQQGLIRIGVFSSVATHWMPRVIQAFQRDFPGIQYELLLGDYSEIENWISEGRVECGFLRLPTRNEFETISLLQDELVLVLPKKHPLAALDRIPPVELNGQPFMLLEHGGKTEVSEFLELHGLKPSVCFTTWDDYAILSMVECGLGIGILPRLILQRIPYDVEIRSFTEPYYREIALALPYRKKPSIVVKRFTEYLKYRSEAGTPSPQ